MDMLAEKAGIDPFEFRYRNIARPGQTNINSFPYRDYPMEEIMDKMRPYYLEAVEKMKKMSTDQRKCGVGLAWGGYVCTLGGRDKAENDLELNPDGSITSYNTWEDPGQGGDIGTLTHVLEALKPLKLRPEQIRVVANDSFTCPDSGIAASSRSHIMTGNAIINAAEKLLAAMRKEDGAYRTYQEMIAEGIPTKYRGIYTTTNLGLTELDPSTGVGDPTAFYMYALFLAQVAVDVETGKTQVLGITCVDDVGKIGNELSVEGQAYGGISHSIGFALTEIYEDPKKHTNIASCGIPTVLDIPDDITVIHCQNPRELGPFGSSGCSEAYQSSGHVAVINAINNATGVRIYELPATPEKIKKGLAMIAKYGAMEPPARYYLGEDMYEALENLKANHISW
jgi:aldehyde oxidoreductase